MAYPFLGIYVASQVTFLASFGTHMCTKEKKGMEVKGLIHLSRSN